LAAVSGGKDLGSSGGPLVLAIILGGGSGQSLALAAAKEGYGFRARRYLTGGGASLGVGLRNYAYNAQIRAFLPHLLKQHLAALVVANAHLFGKRGSVVVCLERRARRQRFYA